MRKLALIVLLALSVGACGTINPFQTITNPIVKSNLYEGELVFDASLKTFNKLKGLCATRVLPPACRTYVVKGQGLIRKIYAADKAARDFVKNNPTLDATNIVGAFTGLVSTFNSTVTDLSKTGG